MTNSNADLPQDENVPSTGRLLGLDYGTVRIGIAVSDPGQQFAGPLDNYTRRTEEEDIRHLKSITKENRIVALVVGLPVHMSGDEGGMASGARRFGEWLREQLQLPVTYWDERFSSAIAEEHLLEAGLSKKKRKARLDKIAAQILLQSFLDAENRQAKPEPF